LNKMQVFDNGTNNSLKQSNSLRFSLSNKNKRESEHSASSLASIYKRGITTKEEVVKRVND